MVGKCLTSRRNAARLLLHKACSHLKSNQTSDHGDDEAVQILKTLADDLSREVSLVPVPAARPASSRLLPLLAA